MRFVLETFRRPADAIGQCARELRKDGLAADAEAIAARCARLLRLPFLDGVGCLTVVQNTSQVLIREGAYQQVRRAHLEYLLAADVLWVGYGLRRLQEIDDVVTK